MITVKVTTTEDSFCVNVSNKGTVQDLRNKIVAKTGDLSKHLPHSIIYNGRRLENEAYTLKEYKLYDGCCVEWARLIRLHVHTPAGSTVIPIVWGTASVDTVRKEIQNLTGIAIDQQILTYEGGDLPLGSKITVGECGIGNKATLKLTTTEQPRKQLEEKLVDIEEKQKEMQATMAELVSNQETLGGKYQGLASNTQQITEDMQRLKVRQKKVQRDIRRIKHGQHVDGAATAPETNSNMTEKLRANYKKFFNIPLDIADDLYQKHVINLDKYDEVFDASGGKTTADKKRLVLTEVMKSEANVRVLHQVLKEKGDMLCSDLAALLE